MVYSFEETLPGELYAENASIRLSRKHKKDGMTSLEWQVKKGISRLWIEGDVGFRTVRTADMEKDKFNFVMWVYLEEEQEEPLEIIFLKEGKKCCSFSFGMHFTGWRTCWVPFSDMEGMAEDEMDEIQFVIDSKKDTVIFLDQIITAVPIDPRHSVRDYQVPFVNMAADVQANAHWNALYRFDEMFWNHMRESERIEEEVSEKELTQVEERLEEYLLTHISWKDARERKDVLKEKVNNICVRVDQVKDKTVASHYHEPAYPKECREQLIMRTDAVDIKEYGELLLEMAYVWHLGDEKQKEEMESRFSDLFCHLMDQGWNRGSSMGTVHHSGYVLRPCYAAIFLMRVPLMKAGLKEKAAQMMAWFSGCGRIFRDEEELKFESVDTLNTLSQGIVFSILMLQDQKQKHLCLKAVCHWLSHVLQPAPGLEGPFKIDGSAFHHCNHYPAYALDGFIGFAPVVYALCDTRYRIGKNAHETMKNVLLTMRFYCNRYEWLVSMSARHPRGKGEHTRISTLEPYYYIALSGSPDGKEKVDKDLASALLRLNEYMAFPPAEKLISMGFSAENDPQGHHSMSYACASLHRRAHWLAGVRGHSRYLWANESYEHNNLYGRYITYGNLQIMGSGTPVNNTDSGFYQEGWDWNCFPGTTAVTLPLDELRANIHVVDETAGFEEMLISDEAFAGGVEWEGWQGAFAMKLHGHAKYDGSFRARKSWFFFDNRIVCLGSDIEETKKDGSVKTTLFQNYLVKEENPIRIGEKTVTDLSEAPFYDGEIMEEWLYLQDPSGNSYYIKKGQHVMVTRKWQESRAQDTEEVTRAPFAKAWIDHGRKPMGAGYEYLILVQDKEKREDVAKLYEVLQADYDVHAVRDQKTGITAYAFFEAGGLKEEKRNDEIVKCVERPCMVMEGTQGEKHKIVVADPDLRLYEGEEADQKNPDQTQREVSPYGRKWRGSESIGTSVVIWLYGEWKTEQVHADLTCEIQDGMTRLSVFCKDGMSREILLTKAEK